MNHIKPITVGDVAFDLYYKESTSEWVVRVMVNKVRCEWRCYYTDDKNDAVGTMVAMIKEEKKNQEAGIGREIHNPTDEMTSYLMDIKQIRKFITASTDKTYFLSVSTFTYTLDSTDRGYEEVGNIKTSKQALLKEYFHIEKGRYGLFAQVVRGKARVKITISKTCIFIG